MLETKDLVKIYKPKKGVPVTALDRVSLKFPDKGMVFLLGKSGSGKSTLLNLLGGLDSYDNGNIIIKGVSSRDFKQMHFDSYRNTYVGFIFQEYNILDEFNVGANIALAIELQGRKATDEEINAILEKVDLADFGSRNPNELSGGQKQRVAIARALVKNPQIIMADEPTGALDSNTGKAIFDTLKKLSGEKLVIVVSHDREFAESYADRIIELADGRVISDVEYQASQNEEINEEIQFEGDTITIPKAYSLTEEDRFKINEYIKNLENGSKLRLGSGGVKKKFTATDSSKIKDEDGSDFKLIKSKLPLKNAFKIGGSSLKHKKFRLVITILLSCISFALFGLSDTFGAYNHIKTCTNSLMDSGVKYTAMAKSKKIGEGMNTYWRSFGYYLNEDDLKEIEKYSGTDMHGVYKPINTNLDFHNHIDESVELTESDFSIYNPYFSGFAEINEETVGNMGFKLLAGSLPDGNINEVAISEYIFEIFKKAKYTDGTFNASGKKEYINIKQYGDVVGKKLSLSGTDFTVTAVIDTNLNIERYVSLTEKKENQTNSDELLNLILFSEFNFSSEYSYSSLAMVGEGYVEKMVSKRPKIASITEGYISFYGDSCSVDSQFLARLDDVKNEKIIWLGEKKDKLADNEILATSDVIYSHTDTPYESEEERIRATLESSAELDSWQEVFGDSEASDEMKRYNIVGFILTDSENSQLASTVVCADSLYNKFTEGKESYYSFCVGAMPKDKAQVKELVSYCYREDGDIRFPIQNSVTYELDSINEGLVVVAKIFLYIGLGFALFAALMLSNFIATSISYKKQEIGILRAIGSRSNDVFRIFFAESFIIAMINFVLSAIGVGLITAVINYFIRYRVGVLVTVLTFSLRQVLLLLAVSVLVAFLASFIPVKKIASKRPIDAIRDR